MSFKMPTSQTSVTVVATPTAPFRLEPLGCTVAKSRHSALKNVDVTLYVPFMNTFASVLNASRFKLGSRGWHRPSTTLTSS